MQVFQDDIVIYFAALIACLILIYDDLVMLHAHPTLTLLLASMTVGFSATSALGNPNMTGVLMLSLILMYMVLSRWLRFRHAGIVEAKHRRPNTSSM